MTDTNNPRNEEKKAESVNQQSIGNQQGTTQTGAQNNGGTNITDHNDKYTKDLEQSGDRQASDRSQQS